MMQQHHRRLSIGALLLCCSAILISPTPAGASSMLYKKNDNHKYEQDLVAVSSTVIPLTVYEASAALHGGTESPAAAAKFYNEEYKQAYLKHLQKKQRLRSEAAAGAAAGADGDGAVADRLITVHSKRVLADVRST